MKKILFALMLVIITIPALTSCADPMEDELSIDEELPVDEDLPAEEQLPGDDELERNKRVSTSPVTVRRVQGSG